MQFLQRFLWLSCLHCHYKISNGLLGCIHGSLQVVIGPHYCIQSPSIVIPNRYVQPQTKHQAYEINYHGCSSQKKSMLCSRHRGSGGPTIFISLSERSYWAVKEIEDRIKNIVPSPSYDFFKSRFTCFYTMRENLQSRYPKTAFMYLLEKTTHSKVLKLGLNLQIWFGDLRNFTFFRFYRPWKLKNPIWSSILGSFGP